jgi:large subunit ribosomal protein L17
VHKLFAEIGPRLADRPGGYARIVRLGPRSGDAAELVYLELVDDPVVLRPRAARAEEPVAVAETPEAEDEGAAEEEESAREEETPDVEAEDAAAEPGEDEYEEPDATAGPPPEAESGEQQPRN